MTMDLSERKLRILHAIIDNYINTAMPVGSKAIAAELNMVFSSATIRNEMNDLEKMGLLEQPHTSAGRIPSERAYRLYVDHLMNADSLTKNEIGIMDRYFDKKITQTEEIMQKTVDIISEITKYTAMVMSPLQYSKTKIRSVQLVSVGEGRALVVLVTDEGHWSDNIISVPDDADHEYLYRLSTMMTRIFAGKTLDEFDSSAVMEMENEMLGQREAFSAILNTVRRHSKEDPDIVLGGVSNILIYPEYRDVNKARGFLKAIETKDILYDILSQQTKMEISIVIGSENPIDAMQDCSIVTATYKVNDQRRGSIGVIGPTRMNYGKVVSVLNYLGRSLSEILDDNKDKDGG